VERRVTSRAAVGTACVAVAAGLLGCGAGKESSEEPGADLETIAACLNDAGFRSTEVPARGEGEAAGAEPGATEGQSAEGGGGSADGGLIVQLGSSGGPGDAVRVDLYADPEAAAEAEASYHRLLERLHETSEHTGSSVLSYPNGTPAKSLERVRFCL
jgi:hypothetical protein